MDATNIKYLDPGMKGKTNLGTIWVYCGDVTMPRVFLPCVLRAKTIGVWTRVLPIHDVVECRKGMPNATLFFTFYLFCLFCAKLPVCTKLFLV